MPANRIRLRSGLYDEWRRVGAGLAPRPQPDLAEPESFKGVGHHRGGLQLRGGGFGHLPLELAGYGTQPCPVDLIESALGKGRSLTRALSFQQAIHAEARQPFWSLLRWTLIVAGLRRIARPFPPSSRCVSAVKTTSSASGRPPAASGHAASEILPSFRHVETSSQLTNQRLGLSGRE